ncbi:MAG: LysE family translocator, partial [Silicimonas sp.]|nr:LysE family translocator [Silicimonas sp.]
VGSWCLLGVQLRAFLSNPRRLKVFNWTMATLLIVSMVPMVI